IQDGLRSLVGAIGEYQGRQLIYGIFFLTSDGKIENVNQGVSQLMIENKSHSAEHLVIELVFGLAIRCEDFVKVIDQLVANVYLPTLRVVKGIDRFALGKSQRQINGYRDIFVEFVCYRLENLLF